MSPFVLRREMLKPTKVPVYLSLELKLTAFIKVIRYLTVAENNCSCRVPVYGVQTIMSSTYLRSTEQLFMSGTCLRSANNCLCRVPVLSIVCSELSHWSARREASTLFQGQTAFGCFTMNPFARVSILDNSLNIRGNSISWSVLYITLT